MITFSFILLERNIVFIFLLFNIYISILSINNYAPHTYTKRSPMLVYICKDLFQILLRVFIPIVGFGLSNNKTLVPFIIMMIVILLGFIMLQDVTKSINKLLVFPWLGLLIYNINGYLLIVPLFIAIYFTNARFKIEE